MGAEEEQNQGRVRSLAAMCAMTIGELVEAQVQISLDEKEEDEELHEEEEMEIIHDLYEAIPPQYRRYVGFLLPSSYKHATTLSQTRRNLACIGYYFHRLPT